MFALYVAPVANVIADFGIGHSQYADDTQLYIALKENNALPLLSDCSRAVHNWFLLNGLSLNPDKSEAIVIGTGARQRSEGSLDVVAVADAKIRPSDSVKSLGVIIDNTLSFNAHVSSVCKAAHFHTRALSHIRKKISEKPRQLSPARWLALAWIIATLSFTARQNRTFRSCSASRTHWHELSREPDESNISRPFSHDFTGCR